MRRVASTVIAILVAGAVTFTQNPSLPAPQEGNQRSLQTFFQDPTLPIPQGIDLTGSWVSAQWTEGGGANGANDRRSFDFLGIPLSEAAKAWTLTHDESQLSQPERQRSEEHTSELQSPCNLVCRL